MAGGGGNDRRAGVTVEPRLGTGVLFGRTGVGNERRIGRGGLGSLFRPRGIAVVGASATPGKLGQAMARSLASFPGPVALVNDRRPDPAAGMYSSVAEAVAATGATLDLAVLCVPAPATAGALAEAAAAGVRAALVCAGGFAEAGGPGVAHQADVAAVVAATGLRLLGPNTSGFIAPGRHLVASFVPGADGIPAGRISLVAGSGGILHAIAFLLAGAGLGLHLGVGIGNAVDVTAAAVLDHLAGEGDGGPVPAGRTPAGEGDGGPVRAGRTPAGGRHGLSGEHAGPPGPVALHVEGVTDGRRLVEAVERLTERVPVVALVVGRNDVGDFARSHTGALTPAWRTARAALRSAGAVLVDDERELVDALVALDSGRLPADREPGVGLVTGQAGPAVLFTDRLKTAGVGLPALGPGTAQHLAGLLPALTHQSNPVDTGRPGDTFADVLTAVGADPAVDLLAVYALLEPGAVDLPAAVAAATTRLRSGPPATPPNGAPPTPAPPTAAPPTSTPPTPAPPTAAPPTGTPPTPAPPTAAPRTAAPPTATPPNGAPPTGTPPTPAPPTANPPTGTPPTPAPPTAAPRTATPPNGAAAPTSPAPAAAGPLIVVATGGLPDAVAAARRALAATGIAAYDGVAGAVAGVRALVDDARARAARAAAGAPVRRVVPDPFAVPRGEDEGKRLLTGLGIATPARRACADRGEAHAALARLGPPVVVKMLEPVVLHKTAVGGVRLGVRNTGNLDAALDALDAAGARRYLVEETAPPGLDLIVGARRDPVFGPVVLLGFGGELAEDLDRVAIRPAPLSHDSAAAMVDELFGAARPAYLDRVALAAAVTSLGALVAAAPGLAEIEVNPLRATADGRLVALDVVVGAHPLRPGDDRADAGPTGGAAPARAGTLDGVVGVVDVTDAPIDAPAAVSAADGSRRS